MSPPRTPPSSSNAPGAIDRREAMRRVALLLGTTLSAPAISSVLAGCEAAHSAPERWTPRAFSGDQLEQVATIAEHIVPATDTPGARAAGVHRFIDTMFAEYYTSPEREHFLNGLADVDARARRAHGRAFLQCSGSEQHDVLEQLDRETFAPGAGRSFPSFFRTMKQLTILGYYTSQPGATQELRYVQVPGRFEGCIPFAKVGRTWAT